MKENLRINSNMTYFDMMTYKEMLATLKVSIEMAEDAELTAWRAVEKAENASADEVSDAELDRLYSEYEAACAAVKKLSERRESYELIIGYLDKLTDELDFLDNQQ